MNGKSAENFERVQQIVNGARRLGLDWKRQALKLLDDLVEATALSLISDRYLVYLIQSYGQIHSFARLERERRDTSKKLLAHIQHRMGRLSPGQLSRIFQALAQMQLFDSEDLVEQSWFPAAFDVLHEFTPQDLVLSISAAGELGLGRKADFFMQRWLACALVYLPDLDVVELGKIAKALSELGVHSAPFEEQWRQAVCDRLSYQSGVITADACADIFWAHANNGGDWDHFMERILANFVMFSPQQISSRTVRRLLPVDKVYPDRFNDQMRSRFDSEVAAKEKQVTTPSSLDTDVRRILDVLPVTYEQQVLIEGYRVDFLIKTAGEEVVLECDGVIYHRTEDRLRNAVISQKYRIVRITNEEFNAAKDKQAFVFGRLCGR